MDTLHFEPRSFQRPEGGRQSTDRAAALEETNLSDVEVFMLRGRRLQAQAIGRGIRQAFAKLLGLLHRHRRGSSRSAGHRHA